MEAAVAGETEVAMGVDKEVMVAAMAAKEITVIINRVAIVEEVTADLIMEVQINTVDNRRVTIRLNIPQVVRTVVHLAMVNKEAMASRVDMESQTGKAAVLEVVMVDMIRVATVDMTRVAMADMIEAALLQTTRWVQIMDSPLEVDLRDHHMDREVSLGLLTFLCLVLLIIAMFSHGRSIYVSFCIDRWWKRRRSWWKRWTRRLWVTDMEEVPEVVHMVEVEVHMVVVEVPMEVVDHMEVAVTCRRCPTPSSSRDCPKTSRKMKSVNTSRPLEL